MSSVSKNIPKPHSAYKQEKERVDSIQIDSNYKNNNKYKYNREKKNKNLSNDFSESSPLNKPVVTLQTLKKDFRGNNSARSTNGRRTYAFQKKCETIRFGEAAVLGTT